MTLRTLTTMVSSALTDADRQIKLASARDAAFASPKLAAEFGGDADDKKDDDGDKDDKKKGMAPPFAKKEDKGEKEEGEKKSSAAVAEKLASALEYSAALVRTKLASAGGSRSSLTDTPGPKAAPTPQPGSVSLPKPPKAKVDPGDHEPVGPQGAITNNAKQAGWTRDRVAVGAMIHAKVAQAEFLSKLGQVEQAQAVMDEAEELAKVAQDPSSPPPSLPAQTSNPGALATTPAVPGGPLPESNASIAAMTKAQAKDPTVREVGAHIAEKPKKDNMVAPTTSTTHGLKISSEAPLSEGVTAVLDRIAARSAAQ